MIHVDLSWNNLVAIIVIGAIVCRLIVLMVQSSRECGFESFFTGLKGLFYICLLIFFIALWGGIFWW